MSASFTPGPWEVVEATEHHGFYIVSEWGGTVCDLYAMSNPSAASVRNGGDSCPVPFMAGDDAGNARLIASAPDLLEVGQSAPILSMYHGVRGFESERFIADYEAWSEKRRAALSKALGTGEGK